LPTALLTIAVTSIPVDADNPNWVEGILGGGKPPHPAVVRVYAPERNGASLGSGALVAVSQDHGLVITNWHVVRDATGPIVVAFPDGFRSGATLLKADRDWDLAALAIWRPSVQPIPLSSQPPQPGEPLTIAGYGSGSYREATGRCTQYVSPGGNKPFEMVELSAGARFGDSGGPIFNQKGELAGVLFGSSFGQTAGSYCGRVRWFLNSISDDFRRLQPNPALIARQPPVPPQAPISVAESGRYAQQNPGGGRLDTMPVAGGGSAIVAASATIPSPAGNPASPVSSRFATQVAPASTVVGAGAVPSPPTVTIGGSVPPTPSTPTEESGFFDQIRNILAAVGAFALFFHSLRILSSLQQPHRS
jgi:hypothetical protein